MQPEHIPTSSSSTISSNINKSLPNVHPTNSLILADGKIFKVQKKRQRKIYSCIPCHQRKIKCSRELPTCHNCLKLSEKNPKEKDEILFACKYFDNDKKKNLKKKGVTLSNENVINNVNKSGKLSTGEDIDGEFDENENENDDSGTENEEEKNENNQSTTNQFDENVQKTIGNGYPSNDQIYDENFISQYNNDNNLNYNQNINVKGNESIEFNLDPNDFVYIPRDDTIIDNGNTNSTTNLNIDQQNSNSNSTYNINRNPSINTDDELNDSIINPEIQIYSHYSKQFASQFIPILNNLPTKQRSDELLENFQKNIHSLLPILDMQNFLEKYNEFWYCGLFLTDNIKKLYQYTVYFNGRDDEKLPRKISDFLYWYNKTNTTLNPSNINEFLILLFAVYYTSVSSSVYEFLSKKYDNFNNILSYKNEVNKYYNTYKKMNHKGLNNPRVMSLAVLQINVLVQSLTNLKAGKSLINISKILRICQFYQLNRDPVLYHALKDVELVRARRIVWWQIFLLDNLVSFFLNLTPLIKTSDFDTTLLIESSDKLPNINDFEKSDPNSNINTRFSIMYLNCMFRFTLIVDDLNCLTNGLNVQLKFEDINKMKNNINNLFINCSSTMKKMSSLFYEIYRNDMNNNDNESLDINSNATERTNGNVNHGTYNNLQQLYRNNDNSTNNDNNNSDYNKPGSTSPNNDTDHFNQFLNSNPNLQGHNNYGTLPDCFRFFMNFLNILSDKMLIMLQKKIILNPYIVDDDYRNNSNLNLSLKNHEYNYTDLQNNLLPSLIHYLDTFLLLSKKDMLKFNWILKNYIPIDELILLMQILATNFKSGMSQYENSPIIDINLKIYLIDQTINSLKLNWHKKLSSVNKLISLASNLWELMILKYSINLSLSYSMFKNFIFPKPVFEFNHSITSNAHPTQNSSNYRSTNTMNDDISNNKNNNNSFHQQNYYHTPTSINCAEIAPRAIGIASASDTPYNRNQSKQSNFDFGHRAIFNRINTSGEINSPNDNNNDNNTNIKEKFIEIAKLVENELLRENNSGPIQETDDNEEGWQNLGTEEESGLNSIDDFHFYKNLKSDVIRLFRLVIGS